MKSLTAMAVYMAALLSSSSLFAQTGTMMNGAGSGGDWMGGYGGMGLYGGILVPILVVGVVVVGLVVWFVSRTRKQGK